MECTPIIITSRSRATTGVSQEIKHLIFEGHLVMVRVDLCARCFLCRSLGLEWKVQPEEQYSSCFSAPMLELLCKCVLLAFFWGGGRAAPSAGRFACQFTAACGIGVVHEEISTLCAPLRGGLFLLKPWAPLWASGQSRRRKRHGPGRPQWIQGSASPLPRPTE